MNYEEALARLAGTHPFYAKTANKIAQWEEDKSIRYNAVKLGFRTDLAYSFANRYGLQYVRVRIFPGGLKSGTELRIKAMRVLRDNGWPLDSIGQLFSISKQAVQQRLSKYAFEVEGKKPREAKVRIDSSLSALRKAGINENGQ